MGDAPWVSTSQQYLAPWQGDAWGQEAAATGGVGEQRLLNVAEEASAPEVASALGLQPGEPVIVRRRLMLLDGKPVELTDSYYPLAIADRTLLAETRKIPGRADPPRRNNRHWASPRMTL
jgi:GntR family transcriptional regulator